MDSDDRQKLGEHLMTLRKAAGLPRTQAAFSACLSDSYLRAMERGERLPSQSALKYLARVYSVSVEPLWAMAGYLTPEEKKARRQYLASLDTNALDAAIEQIVLDRQFCTSGNPGAAKTTEQKLWWIEMYQQCMGRQIWPQSKEANHE